MRVWTTVIGQRLTDAENTRSMLLCDALLKRGHEVTMWTSAFDHINKRLREEYTSARDGVHVMPNGLHVRFMEGCGYKSNISIRRFVDHWLCGRDFRRKARQLPLPDAVVASIPDHLTAHAAISFCKARGVPVLCDVRDKWPDIFVDYVEGAAKKALVRTALSLESRRVAHALGSATGLVSMMNSLMAWGLEKSGRKQSDFDRIFYLATSPRNRDEGPGNVIEPTGAVAKALAAAKGKVVFAFTGTFNRTQHPSLVIDAVEELTAEGSPLVDRLAVIIGGTGEGSADVDRRAAALPNIHTTGWLSSVEMRALLRGSDVGLLMMNFPSPAFNNKAFSYLSSGLPIVNCATGDLAELIDEHCLGINCQGGDIASVKNAMIRLIEEPELRKKMASNVRDVFDRQFDTQTTYSRYADHVERIAAMKMPDK
ncbi:MAG: glycosyltransferase [Roseitalea sp.]|jgi:glycosyltransferase involved in cell wall biosynthesis|nr:glycosyltransferase [Roseitalea sp.]MBO6722780.1 glycosyltransferase [Roseitalea sp.]MBO6745146.1 glycosyltransferase [Roseitalea sp.]